MKLLRTEFLIKKGPFSYSPAYTLIFDTIYKAIDSVKWPDNSTQFSIHPGKNANGVRPIKQRCVSYLQNKNWELEKNMNLGSRVAPGPVDAVLNVEGFGDFAFEWETGNVSSSHRALNKMALGLISKVLIGGVLVVPSRDMYYHLTDRIGNFSEIEPYFPVWKSLDVEGILAVIEVEYDTISESAPIIYKGTDGRALV